MVFQVGNQVIIKGLQSSAGKRYNGWEGEVTAGPEPNGRFWVKFLNGAQKKFKTENMRKSTNVILIHTSKMYNEYKSSALVAQFVNSNAECRGIKKDVNKISFKHKKLAFVTIDVEEMMDLAAQEQVKDTLPAYIFYLGGNRKDDMKIEGADLAALQENCENLAAEAENFVERGTRVYIHSLQSEKGSLLNDKIGVIERGPLANGRYVIQIEGEEKAVKSLKPDNFKIVEYSEKETEADEVIPEEETEAAEAGESKEFEGEN